MTAAPNRPDAFLTGVSDTEFLDAFLGAFLGVWAASPGLWQGARPLGPVIVVVLVVLALYLQALRTMVEAPVDSVARALHHLVLVGLCTLVALVVALGMYSRQVSWQVNLGYGTLMAAWTASVYARPWLRRMMVAIETTRAVAEAAVAGEPAEGGNRGA